MSKQTGAKPLNLSHPGREIAAALAFLNHAAPAELHNAAPSELLKWATEAWQIERLPVTNAITWNPSEEGSA